MNYDYSFNGIDLVQICGACPEAYNAFKDGMHVGYLRLRHGVFTVDYELGGYNPERVLKIEPNGDGIFEYDEREAYLKLACELLIDHWLINSPKEI